MPYSPGKTEPEIVVAEARRWIGTPVRLKGRTFQREADCLGLILGVGFGLEIMAPSYAKRIDEWMEYGRLPHSERMKEALDTFLRPLEIGEERIGDVAFLAWTEVSAPMHLAIMADFEGRRTMIHADPLTEPKQVRETGYAGPWPRRTHGFYRYRGVR